MDSNVIFETYKEYQDFGDVKMNKANASQKPVTSESLFAGGINYSETNAASNENSG
jgi:hypothetical protein